MITTEIGKISGVDRGSYTEYRSAAFLRRILHKGKTAYRTMPLVCLRYELNTTGKGRKCGLFLLLGWYLSKVIPLGGYLSTAPKRGTLASCPFQILPLSLSKLSMYVPHAQVLHGRV